MRSGTVELTLWCALPSCCIMFATVQSAMVRLHGGIVALAVGLGGNMVLAEHPLQSFPDQSLWQGRAHWTPLAVLGSLFLEAKRAHATGLLTTKQREPVLICRFEPLATN